MNENICRFVSRQSNTDPINILHYVLETHPQRLPTRRISASFSVHLVLDGEADYHHGAQSYHLKKGDLFFCLPSIPFSMECNDSFCYIYIGYLGSRANQIMDQLKITAANCVFPDMDYLTDLWKSALDIQPEMLAWRSESILMFTFSEIGKGAMAEVSVARSNQVSLLRIRKYLDDNFSNPDLSLSMVSQAFSYNPKYLSTAFKSLFKMNFTEYLNIIRIQHACTLMEQSFTCIKDIAALCGFRDPMYFSRVFKSQMGVSPREYSMRLIKGDKG